MFSLKEASRKLEEESTRFIESILLSCEKRDDVLFEQTLNSTPVAMLKYCIERYDYLSIFYTIFFDNEQFLKKLLKAYEKVNTALSEDQKYNRTNNPLGKYTHCIKSLIDNAIKLEKYEVIDKIKEKFIESCSPVAFNNYILYICLYNQNNILAERMLKNSDYFNQETIEAMSIEAFAHYVKDRPDLYIYAYENAKDPICWLDRLCKDANIFISDKERTQYASTNLYKLLNYIKDNTTTVYKTKLYHNLGYAAIFYEDKELVDYLIEDIKVSTEKMKEFLSNIEESNPSSHIFTKEILKKCETRDLYQKLDDSTKKTKKEDSVKKINKV